MKKCTKCGEEKSLDDFSKDGRRADGSLRIKSACKPCRSLRMKKTRERGKADQRLTFVEEVEGQENVIPSCRKALYLCSCGNTTLASKNDVKAGNTSSCGCKNIEAVREASITHGQYDHPLYNKTKAANSRAKAHSQSGRLYALQIEQLFDSHGWCCYYCDTQSVDPSVMTLDHVVPFALGGENTIQNCVPACAACNSSKNNRPESEFNNE